MWPAIQKHLSQHFPAELLDASTLAPVETFLDVLQKSSPDLAVQLENAASHAEHWVLWRGLIASEFVRGAILAEPAFARGLVDAPHALPQIDIARLRDMAEKTSADIALRLFRRQHMLAIGWLDLAGLLPLSDCLSSLSRLADTCLGFALSEARRRTRDSYGELTDKNGEVCHLYAICMGKLGGDELNFSSDIDLIFVYSGAATSDGRRNLDASEYCLREARVVIELLDKPTDLGRVFRVDTRLRPFGESGPLAVSLSTLENYLQAHGRDWERYAYIKARFVGADTHFDETLSTEISVFERTVLRPFVYRRYLDFGVLKSLRDMKRMIATEVRRKDMQDHLKLGPGGIREIEFIAQSWQLIRGGNVSAMRTRQLLPALRAAAEVQCLTDEQVTELKAAYRFLRQLENRLQALADRQTHSLPVEPVQKVALTIGMGLPSWSSLISMLDKHRAVVAGVFEQLLLASDSDDDGQPEDAANTTWQDLNDAALATRIGNLCIDDSGELRDSLKNFLTLSQRFSLLPLALERLDRFIDNVLAGVAERVNAPIILRRVLKIAEAVLRRSAYLSLLNEQPAALQRLIDIAAASDSVTQRLVRHPLLLDELLDTRQSGKTLDRASLEHRLELTMANVDATDTEEQMRGLVRFAQAAWFHIAVADCMGYLPIMKVSDRLSDVAELVLKEALDIAWRDLVAGTGLPFGSDEDERKFAIIAYGKLGGLELGYGSDLDVVFLHGLPDGETAGPKVIDNQQFVARLARRLVHFLAVQTGDGQLYEIDTRLRPSGRKGFLVSSLASFRNYQQHDAWTWEHQALTRARAVAGDDGVCEAFDVIRRQTLTKFVHLDSLTMRVRQMRSKMRDNLSRSGPGEFDLKQDRGGIADLEFIVQYLVLKHAADCPALLEWTDNIRQLDSLFEAGLLPADDVATLQHVYRTLRETTHRLALDGARTVVKAEDVAQSTRRVATLWDQLLED